MLVKLLLAFQASVDYLRLASLVCFFILCLWIVIDNTMHPIRR